MEFEGPQRIVIGAATAATFAAGAPAAVAASTEMPVPRADVDESPKGAIPAKITMPTRIAVR
jgi:hypothetical protein